MYPDNLVLGLGGLIFSVSTGEPFLLVTYYYNTLDWILI